MSVNVECISNTLMRTISSIDKNCNQLLFTPNRKIAIITIAITLIISLSVVLNSENFGIINDVYAQAQQKVDIPTLQDKITIQLDSAKFAPLTDSNFNQLNVLVNYQTNDQSLVNTPMKGTMKVYLSDGTPLKTSSIQKGYIVGQSGVIQFATSFTDKSIQKVKAEVYLTNTQGSEKVSNTITTDTSLEK
jgi:hypothetical protein